MNLDDIRIEIVRSWNTEEIVALYRAGGWWQDSFDPMEIPALIKGSFAFAVAADSKSGQAVGMGRALSDGISDAYIQDIVVIPKYRGKRLGTAIASKLIARCRMPVSPGSHLLLNQAQKKSICPWALPLWKDMSPLFTVVNPDVEAGRFPAGHAC